MRKLTAIILLLVFVFNLFGYRVFVSYMLNDASQTLQTALDQNNYNEAELISVKKPTNLPYYNNTKEFTAAYGEVEMNGVFYKYVKSRIYNDSLEMLCIPNISKQQMLDAKNSFTQSLFDVQKDLNKKSNSNKAFSFVKLISEYEKTLEWKLSTLDLNITLSNTSFYNANSGILHKATVEQPPDRCNSFTTA